MKQVTSPNAGVRYHELDFAKGFGIVLVVWGHIVSGAGARPLDNQWEWVLTHVIYSFHMPFFMFISGTVAGIGYSRLNSAQEWLLFVRVKFKRLFPAYLIIGCLVVIGKLAVITVLHVDNPPLNLVSGLLEVLIFPARSSAGFLWFVYTLFMMYLTLHPVMYFFSKKLAWFVIAALGIHYVPGPDVFALNKFFYFLIYFYIGVWTGLNYRMVSEKLKGPIGFVGFLGFVLFACIYADSWLPPEAVALVSLPAWMWVALNHAESNWARVFRELGSMSFAIYLLNTIFIGVVKAVGLKFIPWDGVNFLFYAVVLFAAGLTGPVLVRKQIFCRVPWLEKITR